MPETFSVFYRVSRVIINLFLINTFLDQVIFFMVIRGPADCLPHTSHTTSAAETLQSLATRPTTGVDYAPHNPSTTRYRAFVSTFARRRDWSGDRNDKNAPYEKMCMLLLFSPEILRLNVVQTMEQRLPGSEVDHSRRSFPRFLVCWIRVFVQQMSTSSSQR